MRSAMTGLVVASLLFVAGLSKANAGDTPKPQNSAVTKSIPKPKVPAAAKEDYACAAGYAATPASSTTPVNEFTCSGEKQESATCTSKPKADWQVGKPVKKDNKFTYTCKRIPG